MNDPITTQTTLHKGKNEVAPSPFSLSSIYYAYIMSDKSLDELSRIYGVSKETISRACRKQGWTKQRNEISVRIQEEVTRATASQTLITRVQAIQARESRRIQRTIEELDEHYQTQRKAGEMSLAKYRDYAQAYSALYNELRKALGIADKIHIQADIFALVPAQERADELKRYRQIEPEPERLDYKSLSDASITTPAGDEHADGENIPPLQANDRGVGIDQLDHSRIPPAFQDPSKNFSDIKSNTAGETEGELI